MPEIPHLGVAQEHIETYERDKSKRIKVIKGQAEHFKDFVNLIATLCATMMTKAPHAGRKVAQNCSESKVHFNILKKEGFVLKVFHCGLGALKLVKYRI